MNRFGLSLRLAVVLFAGLDTCSAADYYVSPTGSDADDGRSPSSSWRTIAKVNASSVSFVPGDAVFFQCGGEWRERLVPASSGTVAAPIVFDSYGSGAKPVFWGSDVLPSASFEKVPGTASTFRIASATPVTSVFIGHVFLRSAFITTGRSGNAAAMRAEVDSRPWFWAWIEGVLYVNAGDSDPRTGANLWTASVRDDLVYSNYQNHLVFRNLVADESAKDDAGYAFRVQGSRNVRLENCEAYRAGKHHFGVINSTEFVGQDLHAAGGALPDLGYGGATYLVSYSDHSRSGDTSTWVDCSVENTTWGYLGFYSHGSGMGAVTLRNVRFVDADIQTGYGEANPVYILGGSLDGLSPEVGAHIKCHGAAVLIDGVTLTRNASIYLGGQGGHLVQNVLLKDITAIAPGALEFYEPNCVARFNTIIMNPLNVSRPPVFVRATASNTAIYGNLFSTAGYAVRLWVEIPPGSFHHNFYHLNPGTFFLQSSNIYRSYDEWTALGYDSGSLRADAAFSNTFDFSLTSASPAIDLLASSLVPSPPATDRNVNPRLQGNAFDAGASERQPPPFGVLRITQNAAGKMDLAWPSRSGATYRVQHCSDLRGWGNLGSTLSGTGGELTFTDSTVTNATKGRFYRVFEQMP